MAKLSEVDYDATMRELKIVHDNIRAAKSELGYGSKAWNSLDTAQLALEDLAGYLHMHRGGPD